MTKKIKEKPIKSIEIELSGGPLDGKTMEVAYPAEVSYALNMARSLYVRKTATIYQYTEDWSLHVVTDGLSRLRNYYDNTKD